MPENQSSEFPTRSDTNRAVQPQEQARSLKFPILEEEKLYYPCSKNKGADQLCCEADLCLCFRIGKIWFSQDAAQQAYNDFICLSCSSIVLVISG